MKAFNHLTSSMPSSGIRKIMGLSQDIEGCIHLEVGQPDFKTPEHVLEAAARAAMDGFTRYTPSAGIPELREAIAKKVNEKNGIPIGPQNVVISPGAVCSIFTTMLALVEPGDEVLIPDPGWPNYMMQMGCLSAKGVRYPLDPSHGFQIDFEALEKLVTPKTKLIMINTPGNPTGAVYPPEAVKEIVEFARVHDIFVISDEVYEEILFDGRHTSTGLYDRDGRVATVFGFSKTYAVTGMRVGYTVAQNEKLVQLVTKLQEPVISCASGISQKACLAALQGPQEQFAEMVKIYKLRRDKVVTILRDKGLYLYTPCGAFYILIDISKTGMNSTDFAVDLLKAKKVAVAPGETFGATADSFVRICFATDTDQLVEGVNILCDRING
ncbi:MAG: pyridoxal phosphate-dependent aminotransferase [Candidatus Latescibacter sp.]|nr:pyridoxal phosphate-dependent aminotransferase [Candidatus Latescibacter sp.]